jgi:DNA mismatch repair protein MutS
VSDRRSDVGPLMDLMANIGKRARGRQAARAIVAEGEEDTAGPSPADPEPSEPAGAHGAFRFPDMSLLWPGGRAPEGVASSTLAEQTVADLEIRHLVTQIAPERRYSPHLERILRSPLVDADAIRYRQEILADVTASPDLRECVRRLAAEAVATSESFRMVIEERPTLFAVTMRLAELLDFADTSEALLAALEASPAPTSTGLLRLRDGLRELAATERYRAMRAQVKRMLDDLRDIRSVTVGMNLDSQLRPVEAVLLSVNRKRFTASTLMSTLLGKKLEHHGIADLHSMIVQRPPSSTPIAAPLFRDLAAILEQLARSFDTELKRFATAGVDALTGLKQELVFYASAVSLAERLGAAGLPTCIPLIRPRGERVTRLQDTYNVNLALRILEHGAEAGRTLVRNDVDLGDPCRLAVLTGPNNGGKSVFLQAIGLAHVLAQAGMHVPAASAELSIADAVLTHYPIEERPEKEVGRLHEEAARLRKVLETVTRESLLLSSETFSSTGAAEAAYLLLDVVKALQRLGARGVFSTHLHELADAVERDRAFHDGETQVANLVALFEADASEGRPTYRVVRTSPKGRSYAQGIARHLGIQYEQLLEMLDRTGRLGR